jgi:hypothetical protein
MEEKSFIKSEIDQIIESSLNNFNLLVQDTEPAKRCGIQLDDNWPIHIVFNYHDYSNILHIDIFPRWCRDNHKSNRQYRKFFLSLMPIFQWLNPESKINPDDETPIGNEEASIANPNPDMIEWLKNNTVADHYHDATKHLWSEKDFIKFFNKMCSDVIPYRRVKNWKDFYKE